MARQNYAPPSGFVIEEAAPEPVKTDPYSGGMDDPGPTGGNPIRVEINGATMLPPGFELEGDSDIAVNKPAIETSAGGAAWRGFGDVMLGNFQDEVAALSGAAGNKIGTALGLNESTDPFWSIYDQIWQQEQAAREADSEQHPLAMYGGMGAGIGAQLGGGVAAALRGTGPVSNFLRWAAPEGAGIGTRIGRGAVYGAGMGALNATGAGSPDDRFEGTLFGSTLGAALGGAGPIIAPPIAAAAGWLGERLGLSSGINALARRARVNVDDAEAEAARLRGLDADPALIDVLDPQAVDTVAAAARRPGSMAGEVAQQTSEARIAQAPQRINQQAERVISNDPRNPVQINRELTEQRRVQGDREYTAARGDAVPAEELKPVLATREGQNAIRAAMMLEPPGEGRDALAALLRWTRSPDTPPIPPELQGLSPAAQQSAMRQLGITAAEPPAFTAGMADKVSERLNGAAEAAARQGDNRRAQILRGFGRQIRDAARASSERYGQATANFERNSARINAAELGEDFLKGDTDNFVIDATRLSNERPEIRTPGAIRPSDAEVVVMGSTPARSVPGASVEEGAMTHRVRIVGDNPDDAIAGSVTISPDGRTAKIESVYLERGNSISASANQLGRNQIRDMAIALKNKFPELETISGERISGSRGPFNAAAAMKDTDELTTQTVNIDRLARGPDQVTTQPSERELARATARRQVQAAASNPQAAVNVAEKLSGDTEQAARSVALLGPDDATNLGQRMEAEATRVRTGQRVAPGRAGTADDHAGDALISAIGVVSSSPVVQGRALVGFMQRLGISARTAEDMVRSATDPAMLDRALGELRARGVREERIRAFANGFKNLTARGFGGLAGRSTNSQEEPQ